MNQYVILKLFSFVQIAPYVLITNISIRVHFKNRQILANTRKHKERKTETYRLKLQTCIDSLKTDNFKKIYTLLQTLVLSQTTSIKIDRKLPRDETKLQFGC